MFSMEVGRFVIFVVINLYKGNSCDVKVKVVNYLLLNIKEVNKRRKIKIRKGN